MWHIHPIADEDAQGALRELYDQDLKEDGYISNTTRAWQYRPEMVALWQQLSKAIRSHLRLRAYELITLAASRAIGCKYCMLAHGAVLRKNGFTAQQVIAILQDHHTAGLSPQEVHMMNYAAKISRDSHLISAADVDALRRDGLTEQQITDVALAAVARNFLSRLFDALGADPDPELQAQEPELWGYIKDLRTR